MLEIAAASFKEARKKKIIFLIGVITCIYLVLYSLLVYYCKKSLGQSQLDQYSIFSQFAAVIVLLGFYFSSMIVAFLTIMASIGTVSSELESGIIHTVITKPLTRASYLMGKFAGLAIFVLVYATVMYLADILIPWAMGAPSVDVIGAGPLSKGLVLFLFQPLVILSLCFFGSVMMKTLNNGIFVISIYILGTIGGMVEQIGSTLGSSSMEKWGIIASLISPFDVIFRKMVAVIFSSFGISAQMLGPMFLSKSAPSAWMMLYALLYSAALMVVAVRKFKRKDIG